jgi:hypothetical protein
LTDGSAAATLSVKIERHAAIPESERANHPW